MEVYIATTRKPPDPYIGPKPKILDPYTIYIVTAVQFCRLSGVNAVDDLRSCGGVYVTS